MFSLGWTWYDCWGFDKGTSNCSKWFHSWTGLFSHEVVEFKAFLSLFSVVIIKCSITTVPFFLVGGWQCSLRCRQRGRSILQKLQANSKPRCPVVRTRIRGAEENVAKCPETGTTRCSLRRCKGHPWAGRTARAFVTDLWFPDSILSATSVTCLPVYTICLPYSYCWHSLGLKAASFSRANPVQILCSCSNWRACNSYPSIHF